MQIIKEDEWLIFKEGKPKPVKKCKICEKILREENQSGFCSYHYYQNKNKEKKK